MKKYFKLFPIILTIFILFLLPGAVKAATSSLEVSSSSVTEGDTITATVTVNAAQWNLTLTANGKTLNTWTETVNYKENLSNTFTATYTTTEAENVNFVLSGDITDVDQTNTEVNTTKSVIVNAAPPVQEPDDEPDNENTTTGGGNTTDDEQTVEKVPTFTSTNRTVYTTGIVNLRSSWSTESQATTVEQGTELTLTGTSSETINGYVWYRVSYNGVTKYVASHLVTTTKPVEEEPEPEKPEENEEKKSNNANLETLKIEGITLTPDFSEKVTEYTAQVKGKVTELNIEAKVKDDKAKVEIQGNKDLKEGSNEIKITVIAEDGTTKIYTVTVTKEAATIVGNTLELTDLKILGVDLENVFKPETHSYELSLNLLVKNLSITATPNQADAKVEILGNEEFQVGENVVTIRLTSADGLQTSEYQIKVNLTEKAQTQNNMQMYLIYGGSALAVIAIIVVCIIVYNKRNNEDDYYDEYDEMEEQNVKNINAEKVTVSELLGEKKETEKVERPKGGRHSL